MTCSRPGQPVIGGFATWRNVPITYDQVSTDVTVQTANYLRVTPNTDGDGSAGTSRSACTPRRPARPR
ncbi:hypothetical protein ACFV2H_51510 [Streptomyces sp. NPDC059629]|uniref:hypothetical protein n=1 Tax=Streptomyces sp. NPDC059629 TaxID=3346889 RepID=UPI0036C20434